METRHLVRLQVKHMHSMKCSVAFAVAMSFWFMVKDDDDDDRIPFPFVLYKKSIVNLLFCFHDST